MQKNNILFLNRTYNEATRIVSVIESILAAGFTEILIIDDGSTDDTLQKINIDVEKKDILHSFGENLMGRKV